jgi:hypothetical protein
VQSVVSIYGRFLTQTSVTIHNPFVAHA